MEQIHIGKIIKDTLKAQGRTVIWFASQINKERTNVYDIFKRPSIDVELLLLISQKLNVNFFEYYTNRL